MDIFYWYQAAYSDNQNGQDNLKETLNQIVLEDHLEVLAFLDSCCFSQTTDPAGVGLFALERQLYLQRKMTCYLELYPPNFGRNHNHFYKLVHSAYCRGKSLVCNYPAVGY